MPRQIAGSVYWIENGRQTSKVVDVQEALTDSDQAKAQILYAESSGDKRQLRLARLAYRQFLGKRYRVEGKPKKAAKPTGVKAAKKAVVRKKAKKTKNLK